MSMKSKRHVGLGSGSSKQAVISESESDTKLEFHAEMGSGSSKQAETAYGGLSAVGSGLLETLQNHIEDLRSLTTCKVCVKSLYEPYTLSCGHTFCYSCLSQWFANKRKKTCPDCRADITQAPAPAYLVKELTHIFIGRPELLPSGETTDQHQDWQQEEVDAVEKDKLNQHPISGGLFRGSFNPRRLHPHLHFHQGHHLMMRNGGLLARANGMLGPTGAIRDEEDRVDRCPQCTWELEDGECQHCGFAVGDIGDFSDMSTDPDLDGEISLDDEDLMEMEMEQELLYGGPHLEGPPTDYTSSLGPESSAAGSDADDTGGMADDDDDDDESDEDPGSLDGFIEDDVHGPSSPASTATTRPYDMDTDEAVSVADSDVSSDSSMPNLPTTTVIPTGCQRRPRPIIESDSGGDSAGDETIGGTSPESHARNLTASGGTSRQSPIPVDSSSEDSDDIPRPPVRRRVQPIRSLGARTGPDFNDLQAPLRITVDAVRALADVHRPTLLNPAIGQHDDRLRITSSTPPERARPRITRGPPRDLSGRSTSRHSPYFRPVTPRPTLSRPIPATTNITRASYGFGNHIFPPAPSSRSYSDNYPSLPIAQAPSRRNESNARAERLRDLLSSLRSTSYPTPLSEQVPSHIVEGRRRGSGSRSSPVTLSSPGNQK